MDEHHGLDLSRDDNLKKSRKGAIPKNVDSFLKAASARAFADEMRKLADGEDPTEVEAAISKLQKPKPWKTIGQTALMASVAAPLIEAGGKFTKGFVDAHGGLGARFTGGLGEAGKGGIKAMTKGDIASRALTSGLGGGVLAAAKEGIEISKARRTLQEYLQQQKDAAAPAGGPPSGPSGPRVAVSANPPAPTNPLRGSSNKAQRVGNTPIAAKSGVVRSQSGEAMNPRAPLTAAMKPKV